MVPLVAVDVLRERESARCVCVSRKSEMEQRERDSDREKARARECAHKLQAKLMQGRRVPRLGDTADAGGAMLQAISRERACLSRAGRTRAEKPVRDPRPALPRRSTPRHPIAIASTTKPPDPMPYALAAILLPELRGTAAICRKSCFLGRHCVPATACVLFDCAAAWTRPGVRVARGREPLRRRLGWLACAARGGGNFD